MDLTPLHLTPLGLLHTILSVIAVVAAIAALIRDKEISPQSGIGRIYIWTLVLTCLTGLPIFRHGGIGPPHVLGVLILATLAVAAIAGRTRLFGRFAAYVRTVAYSATVFFLSISTVTETLTRLPPSDPVVASPDAPIFKILYLALLILFLIGAVLQIRTLRAVSNAVTASSARST
jgi:uncharacterized membrane protein